ncbi:nucleoside-diphosphate sugar epimerase/dehydratase [Mesorhizobium sp. BE184]|uniref:polysaccharide biosynthesis protein n=1 Tax=Mesorhizobium sp. BE184 TaxID=2817714 RepID=UPI002862C975|nr:nucleoside-diphosphate sugar epimerase/dehydratase [Mesorhizobium sp. BE184]MDR7031670.1 O-antigen biosynthesis protein WbqV [Mesorhizobium sp. BE184]
MNQHRILRYAGSVLDVVTAAGAFICSYLTIFGVDLYRNVPGIQEKTLAFAGVFTLFFWLLSMHRGSWRYVSIPDLTTIIKVSFATVITYTVFAFLLTRGSNVPRSVPVLTLLFMIAGLSTSRLVYRLFMERAFLLPADSERSPSRKSINVLLYGLTDNAESFIRANRRGARSDFHVAGILDDNVLNQTRIVQGVKVLGDFASLGQIVSRLEKSRTKISEIIITEIGPNRQHLAEIVEKAARLGIKASRIPDFTETSLITSQTMLQPKAIELGDLLGRPEVVADLQGVARLINNKVILVTGAGGSIGSELCRQIASFGPSLLILTDFSEYHLYMLDMEIQENFPNLNVVTRIVNVRDKGRVTSLFAEFHPDSVFHAAALKHVPLVEANPIEAVKTNLLGTRNVADAALQYGATNFVMISTDKAVNPTNVMGATKRAAEAYCQSVDISSQKTRFKTVRFGNVLGSNGSVVPRFQEQIANGGPVTVTHPNIVRFFMTIPEAVRLVLNASSHEHGKQDERGKIMVLDMGKPVRIVDLAERMIQLAGFRPRVDIDIVFTGLRPGEKLYEELFDPSEMQEHSPEDTYFVASPRVIDKGVLHKTLVTLQEAVLREDRARTIELLNHIVPEYKPGNTSVPEPSFPKDDVTDSNPLN